MSRVKPGGNAVAEDMDREDDIPAPRKTERPPGSEEVREADEIEGPVTIREETRRPMPAPGTYRIGLARDGDNVPATLHEIKLTMPAFAEAIPTAIAGTAEAMEDAESEDELRDAMAEALELMSAMCRLHGITWQSVRERRQALAAQRGTFNGRRGICYPDHS